VTVPYDHKIDPAVFAKAARRNFVDELVLAKLQSLNIRPSEPADDGEFLRRAYLDTIGVLPTADEARKFLAEKAVDEKGVGKRDRLIERLLARTERVYSWPYKWCELLLV